MKLKACVQTASLRLAPVDVFHCLQPDGHVSWGDLDLRAAASILLCWVISPSSCINWDSIAAQQQVNLPLLSTTMAESKVKVLSCCGTGGQGGVHDKLAFINFRRCQHGLGIGVLKF